VLGEVLWLCSCGEFELLSLQDFCEVHVEEINVQTGLNNACCDSDGVDKSFGEISVNPVGDIERPVCSECGEIMRRDGLRLACALEHEKLREDSNSLQPDGERPENLGEPEAVVENEREDDAWREEVFDAEGVNGGIMGGFVLELHEV